MRRPAIVLVLVLAGVAGFTGACAESSSQVSSSPTPTRCQLTLTVPAPVESIGGTGTLTLTTQPECVWTASTTSSWISELRPASGQGSARIEFRAAVNPASAVREGEIVVNENRLRVTQQAAPLSCTYALSPSTQSIATAGGAGSLTITTATGCLWSAVSSASWLTLTGTTTGTASGTVTFAVTANTGAERSATIAVGNQLATVQQPGVAGSTCSYTVAPDSQTFPSAGGSGGPVTVTTSAGCAWTARTTDSWITVTSGASGTGNGSVAFTVAANASALRTGSIVIAGQTFQVVQAASVVPSCTYSVAPTSVNVGAAGGAASPIAVTSTAGCAWTAATADPWITIVSGATGSGSGSVTFTAAANTATTPRSGTLAVAGQTVTVTQDAAPPPPCSIAIAPASQSVGAATGTGTTITVTAGPTCAWTTTSNATWLTILTGATGTGNGTVTFRFDANPAAVARTGSLLIGGQTFTVTQAAAPCTFGLTPTSSSPPAAGAANQTVTVTASAGTCAWTATSSAPWLTITAGASGTGSGPVGYTVAANTGTARTGTLTIAGQTFTVTQAGCAYALSPTSQNHPLAGATGRFVTVTNGASCTWPWTATANAPWIVLDPPALGTGAGFITYSVGATAAPRSGTITVAGQTFTVSQP